MLTPLASRRPDGEDGFVLVIVMGLLFVASTIAATLMLASRSQIKVEAALSTRAELEAMADGLVRLTAFRLSAQQPDAASGRIPTDGTTMRCRFEDEIANIAVTDVAGQIDINSASIEILQMLLRGMGVPRTDAVSLAAAIQDFRDTDDLPGDGGAEASDYRQAGRNYGPKNAPFESIEELDQVLGMTPELLRTLRPFVTIHSRSAILDISAAPLPLLQALARGNSSDLALGRISEPASREQFHPPPVLLTRFNPRSMSRARARIFAIDATVMKPNGRRYGRHAVVEIAGRARTGFIVREWSSHPYEFSSDAAVIATDEPCFRLQ